MAQLRNKCNGGKLDDDIISPKKWGDLGHRIRGLGRQMEELAEMNQAKTRVNKQISARVKKGFSYWARYHKKNKTSFGEIKKTRFACVNHIFNDHSSCTKECPARKAMAINKQYTPHIPYLDPVLHSDIKDDITSVVDFYTRESRLREIFHEGTEDSGTQHNEALNNSSLQLTPKTRNYATSSSFSDRIYTMVGVHNFGHFQYYRVVFSILGCKLPDNVLEYLSWKEKKKVGKRIYQSQTDVKKKRATGYASKHTQRTSVEAGYYESNCGLYLNESMEAARAREVLEQSREKNMTTIKCRSKCGLYGHYDKKSYLCPLNATNVYNRKVAEGKISPSPREPPKGKKARKQEKVIRELNEMEQTTKNVSNTDQEQIYCLPCVQEPAPVLESSMIMFDDGEKNEIELCVEKDESKSPEVAAEVVPTTSIPQPASLNESDKGESEVNRVYQMMRSEVVMESDEDSQIGDNNDFFDFSDLNNSVPGERCENENNKVSSLTDLCMHLQLISLCTENDVLDVRRESVQIDINHKSCTNLLDEFEENANQ